MSDLIRALEARLGRERCLSAEEDLFVYECDGLTAQTGRPKAVVFPESASEVQEIVREVAKVEIQVVEKVVEVTRAGEAELAGAAECTWARDVLGLGEVSQIQTVERIVEIPQIQEVIKHVPVPQQLSIVGFEDSPFSRQSWPKLTTAHQPNSEIAETAAHLLIETIRASRQGDTEPAADQGFQPQLVVRDSTCPRSM